MTLIISKRLEKHEGMTVSATAEAFNQIPEALRQVNALVRDIEPRCPYCWVAIGYWHMHDCPLAPK